MENTGELWWWIGMRTVSNIIEESEMRILPTAGFMQEALYATFWLMIMSLLWEAGFKGGG